MAKIITKKSKRNVEKVKNMLEGKSITTRILGQPNITMTGAEAIKWITAALGDRTKIAQALEVSKSLLKGFPNIIDAHILYLECLIAQENFLLAYQQSKKLAHLVDKNCGLQVQMAKVYHGMGRASEALVLLQRAYLTEKNNGIDHGIGILLLMSEYFNHIGNADNAAGVAEKALQQCSRVVDLNHNLLIGVMVNANQYGLLSEAQIAFLKQSLADDRIDLMIKSNISFALAKIQNKKGQLAGEIKYLHLGNGYLKGAIKFDVSVEYFEKSLNRKLELTQNIFSKPEVSFFKGYAVKTQDPHVPISIIGMARSGTTLLEQMLSAHSAVGQVGESKALGNAILNAYKKNNYPIDLADFPLKIDSLSLSLIDQLAAEYRDFQRLFTDKRMYVEKELSNVLSVGLMANLFPRSKFIHISRAPLDIFLSCYKGGIPGTPATCSLEHMAIYYIFMKRLVEYWKNLYPDRVLILNYSDLVEDPKQEISKVLDFLGLSWEEPILNFYERKNVVRTLSVNQVRRGVYKDAVNKWRPYADMLEPAIEIFRKQGVPQEGIC